MATKIQKRSAELMLNKLRSKLDSLYNQQEASKTLSQSQQMKCGGRMKKKSWGGPFLTGMSDNINNAVVSDMTEGFVDGRPPGLGLNKIDGSGDGINWQNAGLSVLSAAPMAYNLVQGLLPQDKLDIPTLRPLPTNL
jgi:hypothetical protein